MTQTKNKSSQSAKFIATAKALGCDEDEAAFKAKLKKLAASKAMATPSKPKRKIKK